MNLRKVYLREFLAYFAETLNEVATEGLSDLMDFLSDDGPEEFGLVWDKEAFEKGKLNLKRRNFLLIRGIKGSEKGWMLI